MEATLRWLDDPEVFQVNRRMAHSDHVIYRSKEECLEGSSSYIQSLSGLWKFAWSPNAASRPADFYRTDFDDSSFGLIKVPGHIELSGFDQIHYINTMYPWEGHEFRRPGYTLGQTSFEQGMFSEADYNPVGSYRRTFVLDEGLEGQRITIRFEGVEEAFYLWLNGHFIGYSEDSFSPAEFDLSDHINDGENVLAVQVHKRSTAAFLEDQDFFRFSGIFRNVLLIGRTDNHLQDLWIRPRLHEDNETADVELLLSVEHARAGAALECSISDPEGKALFFERVEFEDGGGGNGYCGRAHFPESTCYRVRTGDLGRVRVWENRDPVLYHLEIEILDTCGDVIGHVEYPFGFRRIEIRNRVMLLNGRRLILNGVNRHEWSPYTGRAISIEEMFQDISAIRRNRINAVRTCHYPNQTVWYSLCDQAGIYVMAEANLESHGSWQIMGACSPSYNVPGSIPQWLPACLDRAVSNFEVLKNHTSILFWSLGNESYAGDVIKAMDEYYHETDPERLTHYEGNFWNPAYEVSISDVKSCMYPQPRDIVRYLEEDGRKPYIACEYMHSMGNSVGGMGSYMELIDRYDSYQGGFVWDLIDQALYVKDEVTGKEVLRYGGDFDDRPSDYAFSGNGLLFADRTEKPAMQEVRYYFGVYGS